MHKVVSYTGMSSGNMVVKLHHNLMMQSSLGRDQSLEPWARGSKRIGLELLKKALGLS